MRRPLIPLHLTTYRRVKPGSPKVLTTPTFCMENLPRAPLTVSVFLTQARAKPGRFQGQRSLKNMIGTAYRRVLTLMIGGALLALACEDAGRRSTLGPEKFAAAYAEIVLLSVSASEVDSVAHVELVLKKLDISREEYEATLDHFAAHPELWLEVFTHVEELLKKSELDSTDSGTERIINPPSGLKEN